MSNSLSTSSSTDEMLKLSKLKDDGIISAEEFEVIEAIKQEKKIQSIQDSIFVIDEKEK